jgi:hypothetical protein
MLHRNRSRVVALVAVAVAAHVNVNVNDRVNVIVDVDGDVNVNGFPTSTVVCAHARLPARIARRASTSPHAMDVARQFCGYRDGLRGSFETNSN